MLRRNLFSDALPCLSLRHKQLIKEIGVGGTTLDVNYSNIGWLWTICFLRHALKTQTRKGARASILQYLIRSTSFCPSFAATISDDVRVSEQFRPRFAPPQRTVGQTCSDPGVYLWLFFLGRTAAGESRPQRGTSLPASDMNRDVEPENVSVSLVIHGLTEKIVWINKYTLGGGIIAWRLFILLIGSTLPVIGEALGICRHDGRSGFMLLCSPCCPLVAHRIDSYPTDVW